MAEPSKAVGGGAQGGGDFAGVSGTVGVAGEFRLQLALVLDAVIPAASKRAKAR